MPTETITREQFLAKLKQLRMSQAQFARRVGHSYGTVTHWGDGRQHVPDWVPLLLDAWIEIVALRHAFQVMARAMPMDGLPPIPE